MKARAVLLVAIVALAGCRAEAPEQVADPHDAPHTHEAPRGGTLVVLAEEFAHLEFIFDATAGRLTCYVLAAHAVRPVRLPDASIVIDVELGGETAELTLTAVASGLTGETVGDSSQFEVTDQRLTGLASVQGTVRSIAARGRKFENVSFVANALR